VTIQDFWDVIPLKRTVFDPENGDNMIFRNVGNYMLIDTA